MLKLECFFIWANQWETSPQGFMEISLMMESQM